MKIFVKSPRYSAKEATDFRHFQSMRSKLPSNNTVVACYLFHGTPDILLEDKAIITLGLEEEIGEEMTVNNGQYSVDCSKAAVDTMHEVPQKPLANMHISILERVLSCLASGDMLLDSFIDTFTVMD